MAQKFSETLATMPDLELLHSYAETGNPSRKGLILREITRREQAETWNPLMGAESQQEGGTPLASEPTQPAGKGVIQSSSPEGPAGASEGPEGAGHEAAESAAVENQEPPMEDAIEPPPDGAALSPHPLDQSAAEASSMLKAATSEASMASNPANLGEQLATVGAQKLARGITSFGDWTKSMLKDYGPTIKSQLWQVWANSKKILASGAADPAQAGPSQPAGINPKHQEIARLTAELSGRRLMNGLTPQQRQHLAEDPDIAALRSAVHEHRVSGRPVEADDPAVGSAIVRERHRLSRILEDEPVTARIDGLDESKRALVDRDPGVQSLRDRVRQKHARR